MKKISEQRADHYSAESWFLFFLRKNREFVSYSLVGVLTFTVCILSYSYFNAVLKMDELVANVFSWVFTVSFAFFSNRSWVFHTKPAGVFTFFRQMFSFFSGRAFTLFLEEMILIICVKEMGMESLPVKVAAQIIVITVNYMVSKLVVFRDKAA